jgi:hypothetical protein
MYQSLVFISTKMHEMAYLGRQIGVLMVVDLGSPVPAGRGRHGRVR